MDSKSPFFERQIDRSAYGACWGLAAIIGGVLVLGIWGLWSAGSAFQRSAWASAHMHLPAFHKIDPNPAPLVNSAKNAVQSAAATAVNQAGQAAENQAKDQVNAAVQSAQASAQSAADQSLNDFLGH